MRSSFFQNLGYSFFSQAVQLILSIAISFLLPKLLGVEEFGYWQLFIFYTQYAGFFHFGLVDGIYLREGGGNYNQLDFKCLGYQLRVLFMVDLGLILLALPWIFTNQNADRQFILLISCACILLSNFISFFGLTLQSVNAIKISSLGRLYFSLSFLVFLLLEFFVIKSDNYRLFVIVYFFTYSFSLIYYFKKAIEIPKNFFAHSIPEYRSILMENIKSGLTLTLANIAGMLILGFGRFMIDKHWGIELFSVVSFALVIVNFVLMFISQVSLVLYPELRALGIDEAERLYEKMSKALMAISPFFLLAVYPMIVIIDLWLPDYLPSIEYMIILLPVCIYETKNQLQINTYFKVYNRPKDLLIANAVAVFVSGFIVIISVFVLESIRITVIAMLLAVIIKYIVSLYILRSNSFIQEVVRIIPELVITAGFIISNLLFDIKIGAAVFTTLLFIYYLLNRGVVDDNIKLLINSIIKK